MSKSLAEIHNMTDDQVALVKATIAKGATNDELNLFFYRCKQMNLDPLKPGHIHFVKYGNAPGTIIIGIDGFRSRAAMTGKHTGTKRGIIRDDSGKCIGGWCEVFRADWTQSAREEVSLAEYSTGKAQWAKMPETMIKKVAEVSALRMAFPDELGGIYSDDEMAQAETYHVAPAKPPEPQKPFTERQSGPQSISGTVITTNPPKYIEIKNHAPNAVIKPIPTPEAKPSSWVDAVKAQEPSVAQGPGCYVVKFGKYANMRLDEITIHDLANYVDYIQKKAITDGRAIQGKVLEFMTAAGELIASREKEPIPDPQSEFQSFMDTSEPNWDAPIT